MGRPGQGRPDQGGAAAALRVAVTSRRLLIAAWLVAVIECFAWWFAGAIAWSFRFLLVGPNTPEAFERTQFAVVVLGAFGINVLAWLPFLISRGRWGWWLLMAVQAGDFAFAAYELVTVDIWWLAQAGFAVVVAVLLLVFKRVPRPAG